MPRSFWHAFSKSLVAVAISSPVTWHNVSWAIDLAMRFSAACGRLQAFETSTWVSVQDVVLNKPKDRPRNQVNRLPELSHFYHTHTQADRTGDVSAHVAMVLVGVSLLDTKQMRSRQLASFCQLHKSDQKHMSSQKVFTSRHGLFV